MAREKKTRPSDYPIFAFRVSDEEKDNLNSEIEYVADLLNKRLSEDEKVWRKNDVIVEALKRGLAQLKKGRG
ncbi:MAG: hypothetical protein ACXVCY_12840 [Pseudobdellovibrionaceae bacterium]